MKITGILDINVSEEDQESFKEELQEAISGQLEFCGVCGKFIPQVKVEQFINGTCNDYVNDSGDAGICCREHYDEEETQKYYAGDIVGGDDGRRYMVLKEEEVDPEEPDIKEATCHVCGDTDCLSNCPKCGKYSCLKHSIGFKDPVRRYCVVCDIKK